MFIIQAHTASSFDWFSIFPKDTSTRSQSWKLNHWQTMPAPWATAAPHVLLVPKHYFTQLCNAAVSQNRLQTYTLKATIPWLDFLCDTDRSSCCSCQTGWQEKHLELRHMSHRWLTISDACWATAVDTGSRKPEESHGTAALCILHFRIWFWLQVKNTIYLWSMKRLSVCVSVARISLS